MSIDRVARQEYTIRSSSYFLAFSHCNRRIALSLQCWKQIKIKEAVTAFGIGKVIGEWRQDRVVLRPRMQHDFIGHCLEAYLGLRPCCNRGQTTCALCPLSVIYRHTRASQRSSRKNHVGKKKYSLESHIPCFPSIVLFSAPQKRTWLELVKTSAGAGGLTSNDTPVTRDN